MKLLHKIFAALIVTLTIASQASAQTTASQKYTVSVPSTISITAPADVAITHDTTDANQAFPAQSWSVKGNSTRGVAVTFAANQPFTNLADSTWKRDASLALSLGTTTGPAAWSITKASGATDYANSVTSANVQATSNGVGKANFNLAVTFVTNGYATFAAGDYQTTVTGTVTQN